MNRELWPNTELGHLQIRGKDAEHRAGDGVRKEKDLSWKQWGKRLKEVLQTYDFLFGPDAIILGGGVSRQFEHYGKYLKGIRAEVLPAELENQAGSLVQQWLLRKASFWTSAFRCILKNRCAEEKSTPVIV